VLGIAFFLALLFALLFAWLSVRIRAFWDRVKQGFSILTDRRRYRRDMATWQAASWVMLSKKRTRDSSSGASNVQPMR